MSETYKGRAVESDYEQLIKMLDDVFFSDNPPENPCDFLSLLPKLYKKEYNPCHNNFIVKENGVIKGAVGMYPFEYSAAGKTIKIAGIGNVAVAKDSRGNGHMIECMNMALNAAVEGGADISVLGGQRQRYGYFGYEPSGEVFDFFITKTNLRHLLGKDAKNDWSVREIADLEADSAVIDEIIALNSSLPCYPLREKKRYIDIMRTWYKKLYAAFDGEEFAGYFVASPHGSVNEFMPKDNAEFLKLVLCCLEVTQENNCSIRVPLFNPALVRCFANACEGYSLDCQLMVSIFNYKNVIEGYLGVKARCETLGDGSAVMLIHGCIGDERLKISVKNNAVTVEQTTEKPDIELSHHEAIRFICAPFSSERDAAAPLLRQWFPLPFCCYSCDDV